MDHLKLCRIVCMSAIEKNRKEVAGTNQLRKQDRKDEPPQKNQNCVSSKVDRRCENRGRRRELGGLFASKRAFAAVLYRGGED
jgi:hypothetical protein